MAEPPASSPPAADHGGYDPEYWCYNCDKPVAGETAADLPAGIICFDCKNGCVVLLSSLQPPPSAIAAAMSEMAVNTDSDDVDTESELEDDDAYVGNPGDYVDEARYQELLLELADSQDGKRPAPPAAKSVVAGLPTVEIRSMDETLECLVCKETVAAGETATKLPCGHRYHGGCIRMWLETTNNCPVCRYELPTDDIEYEAEKHKKLCS